MNVTDMKEFAVCGALATTIGILPAALCQERPPAHEHMDFGDLHFGLEQPADIWNPHPLHQGESTDSHAVGGFAIERMSSLVNSVVITPPTGELHFGR